MTHLLSTIGLPYVPDAVELRPYGAETWLILTTVGVLLTPFFVPMRRANSASGWATLCGLALALLSLILTGPNGGAGEHFRGMLVADPFAWTWKVLLILTTIGVVVLWFATSARKMHEGDGPEFFTLLLGATLGLALMGETRNLLMIFLAVELASLPSYVLAGFRKTDRVGAEASLKYVLVGAACSAVLAYGLSVLYGLSGTLQVEGVASRFAGGAGATALLVVGVLGVVAGAGFKIAAVPFHFWCPDVFEGAGTDVAAFLSVASKGAGLALLFRVLATLAAATGGTDLPFHGIIVLVGVIGAVTIIVGNTAAFVQESVKRLLAYSSIAHAGYMLCALALLGAPHADDARSAAAAVLMLYLAVYLFMNLGAFAVAAVVEARTGAATLDRFAGLGRRSPLLAVAMTCCLLSLIGLPPFAGFAVKFNLMFALAVRGSWAWALVAIIGANTIVSAFYYFRVVRAMYLQPGAERPLPERPLELSIPLACSGMLLILLVGFGPLGRWVTRASRVESASGAPGVASGAAPARATPAAPSLPPAAAAAN